MPLVAETHQFANVPCRRLRVRPMSLMGQTEKGSQRAFLGRSNPRKRTRRAARGGFRVVPEPVINLLGGLSRLDLFRSLISLGKPFRLRKCV
jgi:hypothetical protein